MERIWFAGFIVTAVLGGGGLFLMEARSSATHQTVVLHVAAAEAAEESVIEEEAVADDRTVEVPILIYHAIRPIMASDGPLTRAYTVSPAMLEAHLGRLQGAGYTTIGFAELESAILRGGALPEKPVILTFDDGTSGHYAVAFPLLKAHGFTATFFPFSNAIDRPNYLSTAQIHEMRDAGMTFGNHTRYHQYLTRVPAEEALDEMRAGKTRLEDVLGSEVDAIAYPFGLYDEDVIHTAALLGHRIGRTIEEGRVHGAGDLMRLKGYQMTDSLYRLDDALGE